MQENNNQQDDKKIKEVKPDEVIEKQVEKSKIEQAPKQKKYYALYLSNIVAVPGISLTCDINNDIEVQGMKEAFNRGEQIVAVASKSPADDVKVENFYDIGCLCAIKRVINQGDGIKLMVVGDGRIKINKISTDKTFSVEGVLIDEQNEFSQRAFELMENTKSVLLKLANERILPPSLRANLFDSELNPSEFADSLIHLLSKDDVSVQAKLFVELDVEKRLGEIYRIAQDFVQRIELRREI